MLILDGKVVSAHRRELLKEKIAQFQNRFRRAPRLVVILVGDNPASQIYVRNKVKACADVGMASTLMSLPSTTDESELLQKIRELNLDSSVDGVLVQLPLPVAISEHRVNEALSPAKDADAFTPSNLGSLWAGISDLAPCTPQGVMNLLDYYKMNVSGLKAVVVGRSTIVGKPMAYLLGKADATVTLCHSKTLDLRSITSTADLVVVAAGRPEFLGRDDFKKDSVIVDVGIHKVDSRICGDVRFRELEGWCRAVSPVPGGVGPMTIVTLLENTLWLAEKRMSK